MTPTDQVAHLDRFLDALAQGEGPDGAALDPELVATVRRVGERAPSSGPDPAFAVRLWESLTARQASSTTVRSNGRAPSPIADLAAGVLARGWAARSSRPLTELATAAVIVLALLGSLVAFRPWGAAPSATQDAPLAYDLYAGTDPYGRGLVPLDPATLADAGRGPTFAAPPFDARRDGSAAWVSSADGSTLVALSHRAFDAHTMAPEDVTIVVWDARTGAERARFHPTNGNVYGPHLSRDGTRLVLRGDVFGPSGYEGSPWYLHDTADGRLLATMRDDLGWGPYAIDPTARRVYELVSGPEPNPTGPRPMRLSVGDLATGAEVEHVELPTVLGGTWETDRERGGEPILGRLSPGLAMSPDGRTLAVAHADREAVTLIDAERLVVERTLELSRPTAWRDRLAALLPLALQRAEAKQAQEGTWIAATFGADGRHLYVTGSETEFGDRNRPTDRDLGLRVVDLERSTIAAELPSGSAIDSVLPAPDGRSVYVFGPKDPENRASEGFVLRRLDARSLAPLAERLFATWPNVFLVAPAALPAPPGG